MRLDRLFSLLGIAPRTDARTMIRQGRVQVDGQTILDNTMKVPEGCRLAVDGKRVDTRTTRHLMMNKPAGTLTAAQDRHAPTVLDLLPRVYQTLACMPVGRLDKDTQGLLLFTTDGQMAHRLLAPTSGVEKEYEAVVSGELTQLDVQAFAEGLHLNDFDALPARLTVRSVHNGSSEASVVVTEGKFHQVKRMFGARGHEVLSLKRVRFGPLTLDPVLAPGEYRELNQEEWQALSACTFSK